MHKTIKTVLFLVVSLMVSMSLGTGHAQVPVVGIGDHGGSVNAMSLLQADSFDNPMSLVEKQVVCGDIAVQGTPIAGNACGADGLCGNADDGNSGTITIAGIPATALVAKATLYWTVLTNSPEASDPGKMIFLDGYMVMGSKVGFAAGDTPCFPQENTIAWKADVTGLVSDPGNGTYTLSGFPGGNTATGEDFTEGVTLNVLYNDPGSPFKELVVFEGLAVTNKSGDVLTQTLDGFVAHAFGPVSATWIPVIGNGQIGSEDVFFDGSLGSIDFSNDLLLDGGTSEIPVNGCSYLDIGQTDCFWDDDTPDVSSVIDNSDTSATVRHTYTADCFSFVAMQLLVSAAVDEDDVCRAGGEVVDAACPPDSSLYKNHGAYVSCVAHATEDYLETQVCFSDERLEEIQSCIVSARARSAVGKKAK